MEQMRQSTLETLGLGSVLGIFRSGRLPVDSESAVSDLFGPASNRGALIISGANGIVGAGKTMQLGSRLQPFGVRTVALDFANAPDGIGRQFPGLVRAFGPEQANAIMGSIIRLTYDGKRVPDPLKELKPAFLLEAIPEVLEIKKAHYKLFRAAFPELEIRSVTSGFPSSELGVGIAHPAFPHEINKVWETVESEPSRIGKLFWALGLVPVPVSDHWSFVLDVLFCGLTLASLRYQRATNVPYWKTDKYVRRLVGPNPFRAHDAIGAKGANFLTWSCLHHLSSTYGELFTPTPELVERKETGQNWYPPNHFRPVVNWEMGDGDAETLDTWILGPVIQMTSLMLHERRAHLANMNAIGELCAQFRRGALAMIRSMGRDAAVRHVEAYHRLHPAAAKASWHPAAFDAMGSPEWQQLYVNAEHDGKVGVITISRESYNGDVDAELNRAIEWLRKAGIERVILTSDFHLSTQMVGADTSEFFGALEDSARGVGIAAAWSKTARRLNDEFKVSVGVLAGKRCMGGMLELLLHCHYLLAQEDAVFAMPEVTLPVVPGMEGCHWPFRKTQRTDWPKVLEMLMTGKRVPARTAAGWLCDLAGPLDACIKTAWSIVTGGDHGIQLRPLATDALSGVPTDIHAQASDDAALDGARKAILDCVHASCTVPLAEALGIQAKHSGNFMTSALCRKGVIGAEAARVMNA
jgi:enoyl-CoA hydratase/carnithine racemase